MARLFLNLREDGQLLKDDEGQDFADSADAKKEAEAALHEMAGEDIKHARPLKVRKIEIADDRGNVLATVELHATVEMEQKTSN
jgi:hypothetical protein